MLNACVSNLTLKHCKRCSTFLVEVFFFFFFFFKRILQFSRSLVRFLRERWIKCASHLMCRTVYAFYVHCFPHKCAQIQNKGDFITHIADLVVLYFLSFVQTSNFQKFSTWMMRQLQQQIVAVPRSRGSVCVWEWKFSNCMYGFHGNMEYLMIVSHSSNILQLTINEWD